MSWIINNKEWLFSGVGVTALVFLFRGVLFGLKEEKQPSNKPNVNFKNNSTIKNVTDIEVVDRSLAQYKDETRILFVDDDVRFKVAKILFKSGWVHSKLIKDCETLDNIDLVRADILFIDIQGVGIAMGFRDEGLGLALAIKEKYPDKKVVIYSAETQGDRFHEALKKADSFLPKNADPYEFEKIVEGFTIGAGNNK